VGITPNAEQFTDYVESDLDGEVVMLNLLKFKERAADGDGSGRDAYERYGADVVRMIEERGGKVTFLGQARHVFIGDTDADDWDVVLLVSYPSRQAFIDMVSTPEYAEAHTHREAGVERTVVVACAPAPGYATTTGPEAG
jgi:uncharacterized protein (DUF1330 family)